MREAKIDQNYFAHLKALSNFQRISRNLSADEKMRLYDKMISAPNIVRLKRSKFLLLKSPELANKASFPN